MYKIIPIIMAGGTGSRLWPLSRESFPKQFLNLIENDELTLLQRTYRRIQNLENLSQPIIICNEEHRFIVGDQMRTIDTEPLALILEPVGRNTAPAITIAALKAIDLFKNENIEPILLILSADHFIEDEEEFKETIQKSLNEAINGNLVIFGVVPTYPATGYGYIKREVSKRDKEHITNKVEKFIEKPNFKKAKLLLEEGQNLWNSGMFVFKAKEILKEIKKFSPEISESCQESLKKSTLDLDFQRLDKNTFMKCPNISIDVAVFEKTDKAFVFPLACGWDDIGSWDSLWNISKKDKNGNSINGNVLMNSTLNSFIKSEGKLIATLGIKDLIIIDTKDALMVASKDKAQSIKEIVTYLNNKGYTEGKQHKKAHRPWGNYLSIQEGKSWQIKMIEVNPGSQLSLQMHHHRSEHWIVVQGIAKVQIEEDVRLLSANESTYIPLGFKHRLSNPGEKPLILIEVQSGDYLGEDDIVRFQDNYGRT